MEHQKNDLQEQLEKSKSIIRKLKEESSVLKKAIWDMLNYAQMYVLLLDSKMIIRLINWSLATDLGFEDEKEAVGKCWTDFLPEKTSDAIINVHSKLTRQQDTNREYREIITDIKTIKNDIVPVKWFNIPINSHYNMVFSVGLRLSEIGIEVASTVSEDSIRTYYRDIIQKDRTMIQSLKDVVLEELDPHDMCNLEDAEITIDIGKK